MFSSLTTKLALKKLGLPTSAPSSIPGFSEPPPPTRRGRKAAAAAAAANPDEDPDAAPAWPKWLNKSALPLTAQAWLTPPPPPVPVASSCPAPGQRAPVDASGKLVLGGGRKVVVVFLRCVGCAFAQNTFLALRALSARASLAPGTTFVAVSHASPAATQKWLDMLGGAWNVQIVIDEQRALYAAWGLDLNTVWEYFNPTTQGAAWRQTGWLGAKVAGSVNVREAGDDGMGAGMGNKWQQGGAWAVDGNGVVVWGGKTVRADEVVDMEAGVKALGAR